MALLASGGAVERQAANPAWLTVTTRAQEGAAHDGDFKHKYMIWEKTLTYDWTAHELGVFQVGVGSGNARALDVVAESGEVHAEA